MREIRYRFVQRARMPDPFARWFDGGGRGLTIHGTRFRFDDDATACTLVAVGPHAEQSAHALRGHPVRPTLRWDVKVAGHDMTLVEAAWREPFAPGVDSPFRIAWDVFGSLARCSFTMRRSVVVHRILLPDDVPTEPLWGRLVQGMNDLARATGTDMRCELERMATRRLEPDPSDPEFLPVIQTAFDLGALDRPPLATVGQVALFLGLPEASVETYVQEARHAQELES